MTLRLNVVLDRNADLYDRNSQLLPKYQQQVDAQIAQARDEYGTLGIYLDVTTTSGAVDGATRTISEGAVDSALNVAYTDSNGVRSTNFAAGGTMQGDTAIVLVNMWHSDVNSGTLGHEMAHHLAGETRSALTGWINLLTL